MDDELAFRFFREFSLLEYALKRAGFVRAEGRRDVATTNWQRFETEVDLAESFRKRSSEQDDLKNAVEYLQAAPPKFLRCSEGQLHWTDTEVPEKSLAAILRAARNVRNNLFHGDKTSSMGETAVGRDECLVRCSLTVLKHCVELNEAVKAHYEEASPIAS